MPEIIVENGPLKGKQYELEPPGPFIGGRDAKSSIMIKDRMVSRQHFRIEGKSGSYVVSDLDSANGTFVNGTRRKQTRLQRGDRIQVGETILTFFPDRVVDPLIGKTFSGFRVLKRIGQGGMGTVYQARQMSLDRMVALKVLSKELAADSSFIEAFHREARAAGQINHPSIVQVYDADTVMVGEEDVTFFAMEFMPGGSVEDLLRSQGQLSQERALAIALDTAQGLRFAAEHGLVHRDIKPGNLMLSENGMAKIGDMGIARRAVSGTLVSQKDGVSGSPHYISPEQARGEDLDVGADIYSLGISLFHMLAGRPPFTGGSAKEIVLKQIREECPSIRAYRDDLSEDVVQLIARMTLKNRHERHGSVSDLIADIESAMRFASTGWDQSSGDPRSASVGGFGGVLKFLVVVAILVALGYGAVSVYRRYQTADENRVAAITRLEESIDKSLALMQAAVEAGNLSEARTLSDEVGRTLEREAGLGAEITAVVDRYNVAARDLRKRISARRRLERTNEAGRALDAVLERKPDDPSDIHTLAEIDGLLGELNVLVDRYRGTKEANEATRRIEALTERRSKLQRSIRRAESTFRGVENRIDTLLGFDPPAYRTAISSLEAFITAHPHTPAEFQARERKTAVEATMLADARKRVAELGAASDEEKSRRRLELERLLSHFSGEALELIQKAIE